ncbi:MAG: hypothetical protein U9Q74_07310, partial [Gemmatimonadota bacterium]|nr:hypothetical protein [Gemmatimonadota bacterium]
MDSALPRYATDELATKHPDELLALLVHDEDRAPLELIEECARRGEAILAGIDAILQDDGLWDDLSTGEWWLRFHMAMILGRLSSARAGGMLVTLMHRLDDERDDDLQDWLAGWWPALFRNKPAAVMPELRELAGDETHDWYIRSGALEAVLDSLMQHPNMAPFIGRQLIQQAPTARMAAGIQRPRPQGERQRHRTRVDLDPVH